MQASGTRVSLRYVRERTRGTTPAGVSTSVDPIAAAAGGAGEGDFTRASGSFVDDGFTVGQWVQTEGFTGGNNNSTWKVKAVAAGTLTVEDPNDDITTEVAGAGKKVTILLHDLRATSRSINPEKAVLESAEVRADRQKSVVRHGFVRVVGSPGFEFNAGSYEDFLELLLSRAWTTVAVTGGPNFGAVASGQKFSRSAGSFITDGFRPGDVIRTASFVNSANNGDWRVTAVTATELSVVGDTTIVDEAAAPGPTLIYPGKRLDVASVLASLTIERVFADVSKYQVFRGVVLDQMSLSIQPEAIVGGTFSLLGMRPDPMSNSSITTKTVKASGQRQAFAAFDGKMYEGGALIAVATGLDFTFANNRSLNAVIGSKYSPDVYDGSVDLTGTLTSFFEDEVLLNKFINETETSLWFRLQDVDDAQEFISIVIPRVKYTGGEIDPPQEGPVPISLPFRGLVKTDLADPSGATVNSCLTIQSTQA